MSKMAMKNNFPCALLSQEQVDTMNLLNLEFLL